MAVLHEEISDSSPRSGDNAFSRITISRWLTIICLIGVAARVVSALLQGDTVSATPGAYDQISYDMVARQVLAGHGFTVVADWWPATKAGQPTAHWSYLYILYVAASYAVAGLHPLAARLLQAILAGVLQPLLTWRIGNRILGRRVGLVAAALAVVYAYFVYYAGALMTETFYILAILWSFDLATEMALERRSDGGTPRSPGRRQWLLLGVALGVAVLLRQLFLLFIPVLLAWLVWTLSLSGDRKSRRERDLRSTLVGVVLSLAVVAAMILPWTIRNYLAFDRFVLLNTNAGFVFFWANHPIYGTQFVPILPDGEYQALIPPELRGLDEAALDQALLEKGIGFVIQDPVRYLRLSLSRVPIYFTVWPSEESGGLSNVARTASAGVLWPFMLGGILLSVARWRRSPDPRRDSAVLLVGLFVIAYSLIHILTWTLIRYRLPIDAVLLVFAADAGLGIVAEARSLRGKSRGQTRLGMDLRPGRGRSESGEASAVRRQLGTRVKP